MGSSLHYCPSQIDRRAIPIVSARDVTLVDCGRTVRPIKTISVSLESPTILI